MVFAELSDGDALHPDAVARFVNPPEKATTEKENAAPPSPAPDAPSRLPTRSRPSASTTSRLHRKTRRRPGRPLETCAQVDHVADPAAAPSPRTPGGTRRRRPALLRAAGRMLLGARDAAGRAAESARRGDTAAEDFSRRARGRRSSSAPARRPRRRGRRRRPRRSPRRSSGSGARGGGRGSPTSFSDDVVTPLRTP